MRWPNLLYSLALAAALVALLHRMALSQSLYALNRSSAAALGVMPAPRAGEKIVIFAPHEDDETLGCGGYIQQAVAAGAEVRVVMVTNGEYPDLSLVLFEKTLPLHHRDFIKLGLGRQQETRKAMAYLGLPPENITFLGYPNQYLNRMWEPAHWLPANPVRSIRTQTTYSPFTDSFTPRAIYCGESVLTDVETILQREQPAVVIIPDPDDRHPDHWPTGALVRFALAEMAQRGEEFAGRCRVYTYLVHRDSWPVPREYRPLRSLEPPAALAKLGTTQWLALPLTVEQTIAKHNAIHLYHSQGGSFDPLLNSFARANELFGVLPTGDWPLSDQVPATRVITDPVDDLYSDAEISAGDIRAVTLSRDGNRMTVEIELRGTATETLGYHFSLHAAEGEPSRRILAEYDTVGKRVQGLVLQDGALQQLPADEMQLTRRQQTVRLAVPWPLPDREPGFVLLRAWTTRGRQTIDETAETAFRLTTP
ncbi:MAG: PIG-L family deacetylase [Acidobacteria bacterium]|nr:PIG-L family deacetylase [Acidobacteriota bacterium]